MSEKYLRIQGDENGNIVYKKEYIEKFAELLIKELERYRDNIRNAKNALIHLFVEPELFSQENYTNIQYILNHKEIKNAADKVFQNAIYTSIPIKNIPTLQSYCKAVKSRLHEVSNKNFDAGFLTYNNKQELIKELTLKGLHNKITGLPSFYYSNTISTIFGDFYKDTVAYKKPKDHNDKRGCNIFMSKEGHIWSLGKDTDSVVVDYEKHTTAKGSSLVILTTRDHKTHIIDKNNKKITHLNNSPYKLLAYHGVKNRLPEEIFPGGVADKVSIEDENGNIMNNILLDITGKVQEITIEGKKFIIAGDVANYNSEERSEFGTASGKHIYPNYEYCHILGKLNSDKNILLFDTTTGNRNNYTIDKENNFISLKTLNGEERYLLSYLEKYDYFAIKDWNNKRRYPAYGIDYAGQCKKIYISKDKEVLTSGDLIEDVVEFDNKKNRTMPMKDASGKEGKLISAVVRDKNGEERDVQLLNDEKLYKASTKNPQEEFISHDKSLEKYFSHSLGPVSHISVSENNRKFNSEIHKIITETPLRLCTTRRKDGTIRTAYWEFTNNESKLYYPGGQQEGYLVKIGSTYKHIIYGEVQEITLEKENGEQYIKFLNKENNLLLLPDEVISFGKIVKHIKFGDMQEVKIKSNTNDNDNIQQEVKKIYIDHTGKYINENEFANEIKFERVIKDTTIFDAKVRKVLVLTQNLPKEIAKKGGKHEVEVRSGPGPDIIDTYIDKEKVELYIGIDNNVLYIGNSMVAETRYFSKKLGLQNIEIYDDTCNTTKGIVIDKDYKSISCNIQGEDKIIETINDMGYFFDNYNKNYTIENIQKDIIYGTVEGIKGNILLKQDGNIVSPEIYGLDLDYISYDKHSLKVKKDSLTIVLKGYKNNVIQEVLLTWSPVAIKGNKVPVYNQETFAATIK